MMTLDDYKLSKKNQAVKSNGNNIDLTQEVEGLIKCSDYKSFLKGYREILKGNRNKRYFSMYNINKDRFIIATNNFGKESKMDLKLVYEFKSKDDYQDIKDVFPMIQNDDQFYKYEIRLDNDGKSHVALAVINCILTARNINRRGEELFSKFIKMTGPDKKKKRELVAPHWEIKWALRELNRILVSTYDSRNKDFQVGFKKGKSIKTNALIHKKNKHIVKADIKNFFPSCSRETVDKYLTFLFTEDSMCMKDELLSIILDKDTDALFLGNPVSSTLANVIISNPVKYIKNIMDKHEVTFSVYADDLTWSSDKPISIKYVNDTVKHALETYKLDSYFSLNEKKTMSKSHERRRICGVSINHNDELTTKRKYYRDLRNKLFKLSNDDVVQDIRVTRGRLAFALSLDEGGKVKRLIKKYEPTVRKYKLVGEERLDNILSI